MDPSGWGGCAEKDRPVGSSKVSGGDGALELLKVGCSTSYSFVG